ncbi:HAD-like protein [Cryphonectria parasitica EP155]|uniref:HAD-like protein n=1 Tax=Cryphonectria parasitica (strain ATCC 38755 / EP155) TaxID=660469 RepID=A0A9P5CRD0_CRYP1|nr:HAD-like protein [Cryphonectria parasitica EP155]KAF3766970.1 HAD-like protein [Cryphonectria parasitica EP155]
MGTCLDWHTSIANSLPASISPDDRSRFALEWRQTYFDYNAARLAAGQPPEDIDVSHRHTLDVMLARPEWASCKTAFGEGSEEEDEKAAKKRCIAAWHNQPAWADVKPALEALRARGYETFVHANGTVRLQLDLVRSSGLRGLFDVLFSSELLGVIKPAPASYDKCLDLLRHRPEECVMVAAHAYDTRGAKAVGIRTVYVYRWTDDIKEDQGVVKGEFDVYLDGMEALIEAVEGLDR